MDAVLTTCETRFGSCGVDEVMVDVQFPDCFGKENGEDCLPAIRLLFMNHEYLRMLEYLIIALAFR